MAFKHATYQLTLADGTSVPLAYYFGALLHLRGYDPQAYEDLRQTFAYMQREDAEYDPLRYADLGYGFYLCGVIAENGGPAALRRAMTRDEFFDALPDDMDAYMDVLTAVMQADPKAQAAQPSAMPTA